MRVFDLHTDSPSALYDRRTERMSTPEKTAIFSPYVQVAACFCPTSKSDEDGYHAIHDLLDLWLSEQEVKNSRILLKSINTLKCALLNDKKAYILSLEDARVLCGCTERVDALFARGIRLITPLWRGQSIIGGAWNTDAGLSPFGIQAIERFLSLGGIIDLSHASRRSHKELVALCKSQGRAPIATHSNALSISPHPRNLTDEQIREIALLGGVIGLNLYPSFLTPAPRATLDDVLAHIRHIHRVGGKRVLALGSDFDGVDSLPDGIASAEDLPRLAEHLHRTGFTADEIDAFFYTNAVAYFLENFP